MKAGIIVFPGSNCDRDAGFALEKIGFDYEYIWHDFDKMLNYDFIFLPGGFSYGDYLRAGALAKFSPVMKYLKKYIEEEQGLVLGVCNGFQILTEAGILKGALSQNEQMKFICNDVDIKIKNNSSPFTKYIENDNLNLPIAHMDGNFRISEEEYEELSKNDQIIFEYSDNPNGSYKNVAGIINDKKNVLGMMPHPERNVVKLLGNGDGALILLSIRRFLENE
ncbi:MAG: phosphoribosylformylglycinamidine synthase subunit PurQ [Thermotogota bacterium]